MERLKKKLNGSSIASLLISMLLISLLMLSFSSTVHAQEDMTFVTGEKINFSSNTEMEFKSDESMVFWSGVEMRFGTGYQLQFWAPQGIIMACGDYYTVSGDLPWECSWWEVLDQYTGEPTGVEFHVDWTDGFESFHIDLVIPEYWEVNPEIPVTAELKVWELYPCADFVVHWPEHWWPEPCTWWEIIWPEEWYGVEFHVDWTNESCEFHIDEIMPEVIPPLELPVYEIIARQKIPDIKICNYFVVEEPPHWWPDPCTWWEILDFDTGKPTGYEFHVDWTNESCEFHIDEIMPEPLAFPFPVPYVVAERKIIEIIPCDWFIIVDPAGFDPAPCSWWEILDPDTGEPTGLEFHIDEAGPGVFHVDEVDSPPTPLPWGPSHTVRARQKIDIIQQCDWFKVDDPTLTPEPCSWWKIIYPEYLADVEFHVDISDSVSGIFHVDIVDPIATIEQPEYELVAERKIETIQPCDWFKVIDPPTGWVPEPCSWWEIISPPEWAGIVFHVDSNNGADLFHIDQVLDPIPDPPVPPPYYVTATPHEEPSEPWYIKSPYPDYAPSGMPDFDERQWGTYIWQDLWGQWSHCGPVAVANSIWWYDSQYEYYYNPGSPPPPTYSDSFPLVQSYGGPPWDDHDPQNLPPLVEHLAWLMDCDAQRTGPATGVFWSGTYVHDMEAGLAHYLSWSGVNPQGDVNGDGVVDETDVDIITAAYGSTPGSPTWNLAADVYPASTLYPPSTDNVVNELDAMLVAAHMGETGMFIEQTYWALEDWEFFWFIEDEIERSQDVVLLLGFYIPGTDYREFGHYVTCAGVNSTTMELLISNPIRDDYEAGLTPGRSPVPHPHSPPEPPYTTHNNASLVSHDAYHVTLVPSPSGYHFLLEGYDQYYEPRIEYAVITCPLGQHDVAVINVTTCKDGCVPMPTVSEGSVAPVNVTVINEGDFTETFQVDAYANTTVIGTATVTNLAPGAQTTLNFYWDTTGFAKGNYTISGYAWPVAGEVDTADNTYVNGIVKVVIPGDVNGDCIVDIFDLVLVASAYGATPADPNWNPNADLNNDNIIDIFDLVIVASHYGDTGC